MAQTWFCTWLLLSCSTESLLKPPEFGLLSGLLGVVLPAAAGPWVQVAVLPGATSVAPRPAVLVAADRAEMTGWMTPAVADCPATLQACVVRLLPLTLRMLSLLKPFGTEFW